MSDDLRLRFKPIVNSHRDDFVPRPGALKYEYGRLARKMSAQDCLCDVNTSRHVSNLENQPGTHRIMYYQGTNRKSPASTTFVKKQDATPSRNQGLDKLGFVGEVGRTVCNNALEGLMSTDGTEVEGLEEGEVVVKDAESKYAIIHHGEVERWNEETVFVFLNLQFNILSLRFNL
ncbi:hypothetical protein AKJ16_DCAP00524 [Drosera capensis]